MSRFSIGQSVRVQINSMADGGDGLATLEDGSQVSVPGALAGETVECTLRARSRQNGNWWAELESVEVASADRQEIPCVQFERGRCTGCALLHVSDEAEALMKRERVAEALGVSAESLLVGEAELPSWGYRNRSWYVVGVERGQPRLGSFLQRSHRLGNMNGCLVVSPEIERTRSALHNLLTEHDVLCCENGGKFVPTNERGQQPLLRYVQMRCGDAGAVLVEFVFTGPVVGTHALFGAAHGLTDVVSVYVSHNSDPGNRLAGEDARLVAGSATIPLTIAGRTWNLGPRTFFQLNAPVAESIAQQVGEWVGSTNVVWDLYAGLGVMSTLPRAAGARVLSADVVPESERLLAGGGEVEHTTMDLGTDDLPADWADPDVVIVNPPRRGLDERVLNTLISKAPERIVYVSCNPATLRRDIDALVDYELTAAGAWNMLAQTSHVEAAVLLTRREPDSQ